MSEEKKIPYDDKLPDIEMRPFDHVTDADPSNSYEDPPLTVDEEVKALKIRVTNIEADIKNIKADIEAILKLLAPK